MDYSPPPETRPGHLARIPQRWLSQATRADVLRMTPHDGATPIHLVARAQFRIGRSPTLSDFVTHLQPETPENEPLTNALGRVNVVGEIIDAQPMLRDGNGTQPSTNGSTIEGRPLSAKIPTPVRQRAVLTLGEHYSMEIIPHFAASDDFVIENLAEWSGASSTHPAAGPRGAIVFGPRLVQPTLRDAVWLFTRVDFTLRPSGSPAWLAPHRDNPAAFLRLAGGFWLVNTGLSSDLVRYDERPLAPGEAAPLEPGRLLRLGAREFALEAE